MHELVLESAARSDAGRVRGTNEDAVFASPRLAAVADGVGGAPAGEVASGVIIDALSVLDDRWPADRVEDALAEAIAQGNDAIRLIAATRPHAAGLATTLTAVALDDAGRYVVANVGDSRAYLLRDGTLHPLTRDDSFVQGLLDAGLITGEQARRHPQRNLVLVTLDGDPGRAPSLAALEARAGDRLLLCSDGLSDLVDDAAIAGTLRTGDRAACAERLIELALAAGGNDNVSAVVADVVPAG